MVTYARTKGLFGGVSLEGAVIEPRDGYNWSYYGKQVTPTDILVKRTVTNPHSAGLRTTLARAAARDAASDEMSSMETN